MSTIDATHNTDATTRYEQAEITPDPTVPAIHITRDFRATPAQLMRAHTDPELFARWVGPRETVTRIDHWDCRTLGAYRYSSLLRQEEYAFRGTFPHVAEDRIVQTFCWEEMPEAIALETMRFEDLGDGWTRLRCFSLGDSFEGRDAMLASGMETGVQDGYDKLDQLLADRLV